MDIPQNNPKMTIAQAKQNLVRWSDDREASAKSKPAVPAALKIAGAVAAGIGGIGLLMGLRRMVPKGMIGGLAGMGLWAVPKIIAIRAAHNLGKSRRESLR